jgi:hypothetical protein
MNSTQLKNNRNKAYNALHAYANALVLMEYKPKERVQMIRELAQEVIVQFAH